MTYYMLVTSHTHTRFVWYLVQHSVYACAPHTLHIHSNFVSCIQSFQSFQSFQSTHFSLHLVFTNHHCNSYVKYIYIAIRVPYACSYINKTVQRSPFPILPHSPTSTHCLSFPCFIHPTIRLHNTTPNCLIASALLTNVGTQHSLPNDQSFCPLLIFDYLFLSIYTCM